MSRPRLRTCILQISGDGKLSVSAGEIGNGLHINALHKSFRRNDQLHRPVDTSIVRPVTRVSSGHHVLIECIINAHCNSVGNSPAQQMSDIKHEGGVALANVLSSQFTVYPGCGCMEYGLKLDPYRRVLPFTRSIEDSPIPGDAAIINKSRVNLPSVRHLHFAPGTNRVIGYVPALLLADASRIGPKPPLTAQTHGLRRGQIRCLLGCRENRRTNGAGSQDSSLSQEFSTRMHDKVRFSTRSTWQLTRYLAACQTKQI